MSSPLGPQDPTFPGLSFPDPIIAGPKRPNGEGCNSCVHQNYCRPFYWYLRFTENRPDDSIGCNCQSWSNQEGDRIRTISTDDMNYNNYMNDEGLLEEPRRNVEEGDNYGAYL